MCRPAKFNRGPDPFVSDHNLYRHTGPKVDAFTAEIPLVAFIGAYKTTHGPSPYPALANARPQLHPMSNNALENSHAPRRKSLFQTRGVFRGS